MALGATLGWRSGIGKIALAYSVLYLPIFYATHEDFVKPVDAPPVLLIYALLPLLILLVGRLRIHTPVHPVRVPDGASGS
jgi:hypothetical protein